MATLGDVIVYDATDPRWSTDPVPLFEEIRTQNPIHQAAQGFWVLARHRDCLGILRSRQSSSDSTNVKPKYAPRDLRNPEQRPDIVAQVTSTPGADARPFLFKDPPDHTRLRGLVAKAFTPKMVNELEPFITRRADALLDQCLEAGTLDLQEDLCYPLPIAVITELLGIPESDHHLFRGWSEALARGLDPDFLLSPDALEARNNALLEFATYFFALLEERKRNPGSDLLSALAVAEEEGDSLSEVEMLSTSILLLVAGHETTVNLLSGSIIELSQRPDFCQELRDAPALWRTAIEEFMRLVAPVQFTGRTLLDDVTIDDVTIPGGSFAMLLVASANRDPDVFDHPMDLRLDRDPNPQLGFGFGLHHCLGAPLARLEARITLSRLIERAKSFDVAGPVTYRPNIVLRGVTSLPVTLAAR